MSPIPSSTPKEWLGGTLRTPNLWITTHHHQGVVVEDLEASQPMDSTSAEAVERHYRRGRRAPSGTGDRWSSLKALTSRASRRGARETAEKAAWSEVCGESIEAKDERV